MTATIKPATPLPWNTGAGNNIWCDDDSNRQGSQIAKTNGIAPTADAAYIVHACNAYPELVAALRLSVELGFRSVAYPRSDSKREDLERVLESNRALLTRLEGV